MHKLRTILPPRLVKITETLQDGCIEFSEVKPGAKILGFQKDFIGVDIRTNDGVWCPDFDMIDYYLIVF